MIEAGAASLDITPPLGTEMPGYFEPRTAAGVHDPLFVRGFVVRREGAGLAVALCDLIGLSREYADRAKARISEAIGLPPERVLICCTHTHTGAKTGDDPYTDFLVNRIADCVRLAWTSAGPAEAGWGRGSEGRVAFNRRYRMAGGHVLTNPGIGNPDVRQPMAPIDPEVGVLCLRRPAGETLGLLANYALHYVGIPEDRDTISADYFGAFSRAIQRLADQRFVAALANGASGDINNLDVLGGASPRNDRFQHVERVGARIAEAAFWVWNEMEFSTNAPVDGAMAAVRLARKPSPTEEEIGRARNITARVASGRGATMAERGFAWRLADRQAAPAEPLRTWVQALRIGGLAMVGVPGELFVELGMEIKRRSPFDQTMVLALANDSAGYLPTARAYEEGGYEPEVSRLAPGCGEQIVDAAVELLQGLAESAAM